MSPLRLNLITIGVVLAISGGFVFALMMPGMRELNARQAEVDAKMAEIATQQLQIGEIGPAYESLMKVRGEVREFKNRVPCTRSFGSFLNDISAAIHDRGIDKYQIQPMPESRIESDTLPAGLKMATGTGILAIQITFSAEFDSVFDVVAEIEKLKRLSHIEELYLDTTEMNGGWVKVRMVVHAYHYCNPEMSVCDHIPGVAPMTGGDDA